MRVRAEFEIGEGEGTFWRKFPPLPQTPSPPSKTFDFIESLFPAFPVGNRKARMKSFGLLIEKDAKQTTRRPRSILSNFERNELLSRSLPTSQKPLKSMGEERAALAVWRGKRKRGAPPFLFPLQFFHAPISIAQSSAEEGWTRRCLRDEHGQARRPSCPHGARFPSEARRNEA